MVVKFTCVLRVNGFLAIFRLNRLLIMIMMAQSRKNKDIRINNGCGAVTPAM